MSANWDMLVIEDASEEQLNVWSSQWTSFQMILISENRVVCRLSSRSWKWDVPRVAVHRKQSQYLYHILHAHQSQQKCYHKWVENLRTIGGFISICYRNCWRFGSRKNGVSHENLSRIWEISRKNELAVCNQSHQRVLVRNCASWRIRIS